MKKNLLLIGVALIAGATLSSCDDAARLGREIQGSWTGTPEPMAGNMLTSTVVNTFSFEPNAADTKTGTVTISSVIAAQSAFPGSADGTLPALTITSPATSTVTGTWIATDDDDITLSLDLTDLSISVDPDALTVSSEILASGETAQIDSLRPMVVSAIHNALKTDLTTRLSSIRNLSDVKVKNNTLKFEILDTDYVLTRNDEQ